VDIIRALGILICGFLLAPAVHASDYVSQHAGATDVVASQGGVTVTLGDIDAFAQTIPAERRSGFFRSPQRIQTLILNLLFDRQLAAEARELGLSKDAIVQAQVAQAEDHALANARMQRFRQDIKIPDLSGLAREEYIANKEKYVVPVRISVDRLAIPVRDGDLASAKSLAQKVFAQAKADPGQFAELVDKFAEPPGAVEYKGLEADAERAKLPEVVLNAARKLTKAGEISPVIDTGSGFEILKLVDLKPARVVPFDEVQERLVAEAKAQYVKKQIANYTDGVRNRPLDDNAELMMSLRSRYSDQVPAVEDQNTN